MTLQQENPEHDRLSEVLNALKMCARGFGCGEASASTAGLRELLETARSACEPLSRPELSEPLARLASLLDVWECLPSGDDGWAFLVEALERLEISGQPDLSTCSARWILDESTRRWGEYLALVDPTFADRGSEDAGDEYPFETPDDSSPPALDASELLRRLTGLAAPEAPPNEPEVEAAAFSDPPAADPTPIIEPSQPSTEPAVGPSASRQEPEVVRSAAVDQTRALSLDAELREIFIADAADLFGRIQELVLTLGKGDDTATLHELGRCLHTLKGASGSVGLTELASEIHDIEDRLGEVNGPAPDSLLAALDVLLSMIESVIHALSAGGGEAGGIPQASGPVGPESCPEATSPVAGISGQGHSAQASSEQAPEPEGLIRLPAGRFEELLELASDLIARRRAFLDRAEGIKEFAAAASACGLRLRSSLERLEALQENPLFLGKPFRQGSNTGRRDELAGLAHRLTEQAEDLNALAVTAREAATRMVDEGETLSRLSQSLWDALQSVQIVAIRSLFQRLIRAAREAARVEGRQVEVVLIGEETGADRPLLDRLYEPLLHVVRNAVGHGIEAPEDRVRCGKPPTGRLTLEARREGNTLVVSIEDDGRGLDTAAIAEKARRLGLIGPEETPSVERLHAIVFHPGFSTRSQANAISGRGVGMDIVAREVGSLRGRIELDSRPGAGTRLTLRLPSRLALEHMMIVRVDDQAYGVPITLIESIHVLGEVEILDGDQSGSLRIGDRIYPVVDSRSVLAVSGDPRPPCSKVLIVRADADTAAVLVDGIDGPRELVIKPLGALLAGHPAISGTSVMTSGEVVQSLDVAGLIRLAHIGADRGALPIAVERSSDRTPVLVVDDSLSVRRVATRQLRALGFAIDEANDGEQALGKLRERPYRLILTDLEMPRMDGFELLAELSRTGLLDTTAVIVASTRSDPETRRRALALGATAFLAKPVSAEDLARAVEPVVTGADRRVVGERTLAQV